MFCALATQSRKCERKCKKESPTERRKQVFLFSSAAYILLHIVCFHAVNDFSFHYGPSVKVYRLVFGPDITFHFK